jgi:hypothetical protein
MKTTLKLEAIGDNTARAIAGWKRLLGDELMGDIKVDRPWVAKLTGLFASGKFQHDFLRGNKDYTDANSKGSRGVYFWFTLESGDYYEVNDLQTWKRTERYFCKVTEEGEIEIVDEIEIQLYFERKIMTEWQERKNGERKQTTDGD